MHEVDTLLVGAGPIGLELAVALRWAEVKLLHVDARQVAHTVTWYPRSATFFSSPERIAIAGLPLNTPDQSKATREEYLAYLRGVVERFDLPIETFTRVVRLVPGEGEGGFEVTLQSTYDPSEAREVRARRVILAIGDMHRPRLLHVDGEDLPHVSHYFDEPHRYFRRRLLIVGGRNSAAEAAVRCHRAGARVTMSYRGPNFEGSGIKYWLLPELKSLIEHGRIAFHPQTRVERITPRRVMLRKGEGEGEGGGRGEAVEVEAEAVLLMTGYEQDRTLLEMAGVELVGENHAPRVDQATMMTDVPGLYIAGTAAAGTQRHFRLFIENCHVHVARIVRSMTGKDVPGELINTSVNNLGLPES